MYATVQDVYLILCLAMPVAIFVGILFLLCEIYDADPPSRAVMRWWHAFKGTRVGTWLRMRAAHRRLQPLRCLAGQHDYTQITCDFWNDVRVCNCCHKRQALVRGWGEYRWKTIR